MPVAAVSTMNFHNDKNAQTSFSYSIYCKAGFLKKKLELHIKSSDAVLKNESMVANGIELPAFSKKG